MNSSANRRIFRAAEAEEDIFVVGESVGRHIGADGALTTVGGLIEGAKRAAETIIAEARAEAGRIIADADSVRAEGFEAGLRAGGGRAEDAAAENLELIRAAAAEGLAIRDAMIDEALPAMARAVAMACRRIVGGAFEADPTLTADACADAVRNAAGQQMLSIRVNPEAFDAVRASLVDIAEYVRPDESIDLGGCVIDLRNGTIDATLNARLSLMDLALRAAGGAGG